LGFIDQLAGRSPGTTELAFTMSDALHYLHWPQVIELSNDWNYVFFPGNMPWWAEFFTSTESKSFRHNPLLQNAVILRKQQKISSGGGSAFLDMSSVAGWDMLLNLLNCVDQHWGGRFLEQYHWLLQFTYKKWFIKKKSYFCWK
jgi:hypothetical protein